MASDSEKGSLMKKMSSKGKKSSQRAEELRKDIPIEEHMWDVDKVLSHYRVSKFGSVNLKL